MKTKLSLALIVILAFVAMTGFAFRQFGEQSRPIEWRIAGPVFNNIQVITNPQSGDTAPFAMLSLTAKGDPGDAQIGGFGTTIPVAPTSLCPEGVPLQLKFDGGFVATFSDQSMLFFAIDTESDQNALCVFMNPAVPNTGIFDYVITGGAGRFEGASGNATVKVTAWGVTPALAGEIGEITGTIELP